MDFDFSRLGAPFRMQPGLTRLGPNARHLTPLDPASALYREKLAVSRAGAALHAVQGFDPSDALHAIAACAQSTGLSASSARRSPLELRYEEDLAILDASTGTVPWMCVCVPSGWAPETRLGRSLAEIHAPVADNAQLRAAMPRLARLVTNGDGWERHVWTIGSCPQFDLHPRRRPRRPWPPCSDPDAFVQQCYFRAERQTFLPVADRFGQRKPQAVFTIRVMVEPLASVVDDADKAQRLHDALGSMSAGILAYKHLEPAHARLLQWLAIKAAESTDDRPVPV